jgi:hypothetical protein
MPAHIVQTFIFGVCGLFVLALGYFVNRWVTGLDSTLDRLNGTMSKLAESLDSLDGRIDRVEWHVENHRTVIEQMGTGVCSNPGCPFPAQVFGARIGMRTRKEDTEE